MTRVYFNLARDHEVILDGEGIDVADVRQAVLEVVDTLKELQQGESPAQACWNGWMASITDEDGSVVAIIPLSTTSQ
jgi:hypothetical protein